MVRIVSGSVSGINLVPKQTSMVVLQQHTTASDELSGLELTTTISSAVNQQGGGNWTWRPLIREQLKDKELSSLNQQLNAY